MTKTELENLINDLVEERTRLYKMIDMYRELSDNYEEQVKLLKEQNIILKKRCGLE